VGGQITVILMANLCNLVAPLSFNNEKTMRKTHLSESKFNEFKPRLKSTKNWFQLSTGLNLETLNTILSGTNHA